MKYMDIGCTVNCWECKEQCSIKDTMKLSITHHILEYFFYSTIIDYLKAQAGLLITQGKNPKDVDDDLKVLAVSFYVARLKMIEAQET